MRLALIVGVIGGLSLVACRQPTRGGLASPDLAEHLISLERSALDRWIHADPDGYLALYSPDATYFDPFRDKRVDGLVELNAQVGAIRGMKLPFTEPRYEILRPRVDVEGNIAVLSFNLVNFGKPSGSAQEKVLSRWNATEVYRRLNGDWKIIHAHWSFTQPQLAGAPAN